LTHVVILTSTYPFGNGEEFIEAELLGLARNGVKVTIIPTWPRGKLREINFPEYIGIHLLEKKSLNKYQFLKSFRDNLKMLSIEKQKVTPRILKSIAKESLAASLVTQLLNFVSKNRIDHIHAYWATGPALLAMTVSERSNTEWSFSAHSGDIVEGMNLRGKIESAKRVRFSNNRGAVQLNSKYNLDFDSEVINHGVNFPHPDEMTLKIKRDPLNIVCVASLIPIKGHKYLLESFSILKQYGIEPKLHLFGTGPLKKELENMAKSLGIRKNVSFHDQIQHNVLMKHFAHGNFDLMILPSVTAKSGQEEGTPVSLIEAASYGIPIISTKSGSIRDLIPFNYEGLVEPKNSEALADAIEKFVLMNQAEYELLVEYFRNLVSEKYCILHTSEKFAKFLCS